MSSSILCPCCRSSLQFAGSNEEFDSVTAISPPWLCAPGGRSPEIDSCSCCFLQRRLCWPRTTTAVRRSEGNREINHITPSRGQISCMRGVSTAFQRKGSRCGGNNAGRPHTQPASQDAVSVSILSRMLFAYASPISRLFDDQPLDGFARRQTGLGLVEQHLKTGARIQQGLRIEGRIQALMLVALRRVVGDAPAQVQDAARP